MTTEADPPPTVAATTVAKKTAVAPEKRHRSVFEVPANFFDSCVLLSSPHSSAPSTTETSRDSGEDPETQAEENLSQNAVVASRWTCNTCRAEFESLQDQRSHFKSDIHRFNVNI